MIRKINLQIYHISSSYQKVAAAIRTPPLFVREYVRKNYLTQYYKKKGAHPHNEDKLRFAHFQRVSLNWSFNNQYWQTAGNGQRGNIFSIADE